MSCRLHTLTVPTNNSIEPFSLFWAPPQWSISEWVPDRPGVACHSELTDRALNRIQCARRIARCCWPACSITHSLLHALTHLVAQSAELPSSALPLPLAFPSAFFYLIGPIDAPLIVSLLLLLLLPDVLPVRPIPVARPCVPPMIRARVSGEC